MDLTRTRYLGSKSRTTLWRLKKKLMNQTSSSKKSSSQSLPNISCLNKSSSICPVTTDGEDLIQYSSPRSNCTLPRVDHSLPSIDHYLPSIDQSLPSIDHSLPNIDHNLTCSAPKGHSILTNNFNINDFQAGLVTWSKDNHLCSIQ